MFKNLLILISFLGFSMGMHAQNEANVWYFGDEAGMDFNGGAPVALTNSAMYTNEGCASISDASGSLLFYTNGVSVWNSTHVEMPNGTGLLGEISATQGPIIIPKPGNSDIYYIFTATSYGSPDGFKYSEVDMTLNTGLGDITTKNFSLQTPVAEKVTAVWNNDNTGIWVITHGYTNNNFYAYLVDSSGVDTVPVISSGGSVHSGGIFTTYGQMKVSPDGSKLALAVWDILSVELFDFDNSTGIVSNMVRLPDGDNDYGIEFSPDNSLLYRSTLDNFGTSSIFQYDITSHDSVTIASTEYLVGSFTGEYGSIQNGPDGKMYVAVIENLSLGVINSPNLSGVACNFVQNGFNLGGKESQGGLPNFVVSPFNSVITSVNTPEAKQVKLFPNPISDYCTLSFENKLHLPHSLSVFNSLGEVVMKLENITKENIRINRGELPEGIYIVQLQSEDAVVHVEKLLFR